MTGDNFSLRVGRAVLYENDAKWNFLINLYPFNTAYFVLGGDGFVRIGDQVTALRAGHVYLIPSNTLFSCWCGSKIHKLYVEFYFELVTGEDVFSGFNGTVVELPIPVDTIWALSECVERDTLEAQMRFQGMLLSALAPLTVKATQRPVKDLARFKRVLWDIAHNLSGELRLTQIAQRHGWNPSTLSREFHKAFGCTMKQYTDRLLVNALRQELILSGKTLSQLAGEYRFCDAYYLSAFFKRHIGVSPGQYRKRYAQGSLGYAGDTVTGHHNSVAPDAPEEIGKR